MDDPRALPQRNPRKSSRCGDVHYTTALPPKAEVRGDASPHRAADAACCCRRGDRITRLVLLRFRRPDCMAGHVRLELRNVVANYPFERSHGFAGIQPNSGHGDNSRLSCGVRRRSSGLMPDLVGSPALARYGGDLEPGKAGFGAGWAAICLYGRGVYGRARPPS
jgi:hypothetical protein